MDVFFYRIKAYSHFEPDRELGSSLPRQLCRRSGSSPCKQARSIRKHATVQYSAVILDMHPSIQSMTSSPRKQPDGPGLPHPPHTSKPKKENVGYTRLIIIIITGFPCFRTNHKHTHNTPRPFYPILPFASFTFAFPSHPHHIS